MDGEKFVLTKKVHFGGLRNSIEKGTVITVNKELEKFEACGIQHNGLNDINICFRLNCLVPYVEGETKVENNVRLAPKVQERLEKGKMEVIKSDLDGMEKTIDISDTKNEAVKQKRAEEAKSRRMEVIKEDNSKEVRGLKVVNNDAKRATMSVKSADTDAEILAQVNAEGVQSEITVTTQTKKIAQPNSIKAVEEQDGRVIKSIGKSEPKTVSGLRKLVAKHSSGSEEKAKERAESRKRSISARKAKQQGSAPAPETATMESK